VHIAVVNGPNLNLLGVREPERHGTSTLAVGVPFVEVHLSNVWARDEERRRSLLADLAVGVVAGFGAESYLLALDGIAAWLRSPGAAPPVVRV